MKRYNPIEIEQKWQDEWERSGIYHVDLSDTSKPKYLGFSMLPGITGAGIHIGHGRTFQFSDIKVRAKRQQGFNAYNPIGWDSFGLPVENYAIKVGKKPREAHDEAKANFIRQLKRLGYSYDWSKEISTADPQYYKWTQWIFNQLLKHDLAYQKEQDQWWCETDNTVLANEQVEGGKCWRCGNPVTKKKLKQWFFRITAYADEILEATDDLDWTEMVKTMQKNWIGRSQGAEVEFKVVNPKTVTPNDSLKFTPELTAMILDGSKTSTIRLEEKNLQVGNVAELKTRDGGSVESFGFAKITQIRKMALRDIPNDLAGHEPMQDDSQKLRNYTGYYGDSVTLDTEFVIYDFEPIATDQSTDIVTVFTTRPDTLFGATFMVLAPEHELVSKITTDEQQQEVEKYVKQAAAKSDLERQEGSKEKTGVFTGAYAINPVTGGEIPIWIADYVLTGYGTGAIMAVPAHDERDGEFAAKFGLDIKQVVMSTDIDSANPPQPKFEMVERPTVIVHLRDKSTGKYALLDWHNTLEGVTTAIMGGIEPGQTPEQAALAEISEEAGLKATIVSQLPWVTSAEYFASHKSQNRRAIVYSFLAEVDNLNNQEPVDNYEVTTHTLKWVDESEVAAALTPSHQKLVWDLLHNGGRLTGEGELINSGQFDGMPTSEARENIVAWLEQQSVGRAKVQFKMRDWLISRQRYWGAPIPVVYCQKDGVVPIPDDQLPVVLPDIDDFKPKGGATSALAQADDWVNTVCPTCNGPAKRETDTMDGYACSSWYFLRYIDPFNDQQAWSPQAAEHWQPVDYYNGADHAVAHLLYSRFWMRFFHKLGLVPSSEPFKRMMYNAYIMAPDGQKMSKSKGNVIDPMEIMDSGYGADSLRVYEMFIAPYDQDAPWDTRGVPGTYRFLNRVWNLVQEYIESGEGRVSESVAKQVTKIAHATIKKVTSDIEDDKFNTAIAYMMESVNALYKLKEQSPVTKSGEWQFALESLLMVLSPFAPHITEELWHDLGHTDTIHVDHWPEWDDTLIASEAMTIIVQVNGKLRAKLELAKDSTEAEVKNAAIADGNVQKHLNGSQPSKVIYVPGRLVNIVLV